MPELPPIVYLILSGILFFFTGNFFSSLEDERDQSFWRKYVHFKTCNQPQNPFRIGWIIEVVGITIVTYGTIYALGHGLIYLANSH